MVVVVIVDGDPVDAELAMVVNGVVVLVVLAFVVDAGVVDLVVLVLVVVRGVVDFEVLLVLAEVRVVVVFKN